MASLKKLRSAGAAGMIALALVAGGCAASSDPGSWEEADELGKIEENFLRACTEANADSVDDASALAAYCGCSYDDLRSEYNADFDGFVEVNRSLSQEPEAIPPNVVGILEACRSAHLPT